MKIAGREYADRPPFRGSTMDRVRRLAAVVDSLEFAASRCTEVERSLYRAIREAQAHAENLLANQIAEKPRPLSLLDDLPGSFEP